MKKCEEQEQKAPCALCPWRTANHGKRHEHGFYTKKNLTRLWNQIRRGGGMQSCHPTDPGHPDHEAKPDSTAQECVGSLILVMKEMRHVATLGDDPNVLGDVGVDAYLKVSRERHGLTKEGMLFWAIVRQTPKPFGEGKPLPNFSLDWLDGTEYGRL